VTQIAAQVLILAPPPRVGPSSAGSTNARPRFQYRRVTRHARPARSNRAAQGRDGPALTEPSSRRPCRTMCRGGAMKTYTKSRRFRRP
jgi:hypothetical protein